MKNPRWRCSWIWQDLTFNMWPYSAKVLVVKGLILLAVITCALSTSNSQLCRNLREEFMNHTVRYAKYCPRLAIQSDIQRPRQRANIDHVEFDTDSQIQVANMSHRSTIQKLGNLSLQAFWDLYDGKWPVVITDIIPTWKAFTKWNKNFFRQRFSDSRVAVKSVQGSLSKATGQMTDMGSFLDLLDKPSSLNSWTYMEDELFLIDKPELRKDIGDIYLLEENLFTLFPEEIRPWDCMMLWGSKHSRSSLHVDPYNWTAISAVLWGKKHWKLYPPGQDQYLYIQPHLKCGFPLQCRKYDSPIDAFNPDYTRYPNFSKANYLEVLQERGEILVIPSGWFHQAYNGEETLSISTQLMNRNNYRIILEEIVKGNNLNPETFIHDLGHLSPHNQVKHFMAQLPLEILENGKRVTERVLNNLQRPKDDR